MRRLTTFMFLPVLLVGGCRKDPPPPPGPVPATLELWPSDFELSRGQTRDLVATLLDTAGVKLEATLLWSSSNDGVATVSPDGVVAALDTGQTVITVRAWEAPTRLPDPRLSDFATVTVKERLTLDVSAKQLRVSEEHESGEHPGDEHEARTRGCWYRLTAVALGGAKNDSATWAESSLEFVDTTGTKQAMTITDTEMVDRFGSAVIRTGETLTTDRFATNPTPNFQILYRIRYLVGSELRSESVSLSCQGTGE